jgi:hypothetical protein
MNVFLLISIAGLLAQDAEIVAIFFYFAHIFLFQASSDQTNVDIFLPFMLALTIAMYISVLGIIVIICQYTWPTVFLVIPLGWLNFWFRVRAHIFILLVAFSVCNLTHSQMKSHNRYVCVACLNISLSASKLSDVIFILISKSSL